TARARAPVPTLLTRHDNYSFKRSLALEIVFAIFGFGNDAILIPTGTNQYQGKCQPKANKMGKPKQGGKEEKCGTGALARSTRAKLAPVFVSTSSSSTLNTCPSFATSPCRSLSTRSSPTASANTCQSSADASSSPFARSASPESLLTCTTARKPSKLNPS